MIGTDVKQLVSEGIAAVEKGNTWLALAHFENAAKQQPSPAVASYLGYCLAKERRQMQKAALLCSEAIRLDPNNSVHYLNLGRVYLLADQKSRAIQTFRKGLKTGRNRQIVEELKALGLRKEPFFSSLSRTHFLNKYVGMLLNKIA